MEKDALISIIITTHNRPEVLKPLLESIDKTVYRNKEVIVVNNSSDDYKVPYEQMLQNFPQVKHLWNGKNLYIAAGFNEGLKSAEGEFILYCGDDSILEKNMLGYLVDCLNSSKDIAITGPVLYYVGRDVVLTGGHSLSLSTGIPLNKRKNTDKNREVDIVDVIFMTRKEILDEIGGLDEKNFPFYLETADLCARAIKKGYKCIISANAKAWHDYGPLKAGLIPEPDRYRNTFIYYFLMKTKIRYIRKHANAVQKIIFFPIFLPLLTIWHFSIVVVRSRNKPLERIRFLLKGVWDGVFGSL